MMSSKLEDFEVLKLIGSGSFASCYKVRNKISNDTIVWKEINYGHLSEDKKQVLVNEVTLLKDLRHPNIVKYYDRIIQVETKQLYILMEYCSDGDLATLINSCKSNSTYIAEGFVWCVLHQLSSALEACESWLISSVVLHRDIKPANVFLDANGNVKLGDFGLACKLEAGESTCTETMVGTPFYMSPEVLKKEVYSSKSDVWSVGCLIYELCALEPPFSAQNISELASKVSQGKFFRIPIHYSDSLQRVLESLLEIDQRLRPSTKELVQNQTIVFHLKEHEKRVKSLQSTQFKIATVCAPVPRVSSCRPKPEEISQRTFKAEWLTRIQNILDREAVLRNKEENLNEREYAISQREHGISIMERMVKDKFALAEVYLNQSKKDRSASGGQRCCQMPPKIKKTPSLDDSFSADPGDTSILPTSTYLDLNQLSRPVSFAKRQSERRVHFRDDDDDAAALVTVSKSQHKEIRMQQKVLQLPGYTGRPITVSVPTVNTNDRRTPSSEHGFPYSNDISSSPVKFTVLFDDREQLQKATCTSNQIDSLDLETKYLLHSGFYAERMKKMPSVNSANIDIKMKSSTVSDFKKEKNTLRNSVIANKAFGGQISLENCAKYVKNTSKTNTKPLVACKSNASLTKEKSRCYSSTSKNSQTSLWPQEMAFENNRHEMMMNSRIARQNPKGKENKCENNITRRSASVLEAGTLLSRVHLR